MKRFPLPSRVYAWRLLIQLPRPRLIAAERDHHIHSVARLRLALLNAPTRGAAKLTWDQVGEIRARAQRGVPQSEIALALKISPALCNDVVHERTWNCDACKNVRNLVGMAGFEPTTP
jgi:hypothetical protein